MGYSLNLVASHSLVGIRAICNHGGTVYAVTTGGGNLYVKTGSAWVPVVTGNPIDPNNTGTWLVSANGNLYAVVIGTNFHDFGGVYQWNGSTAWIDLNLPGAWANSMPSSAVGFAGELYVSLTQDLGASGNRQIVKWTGSAWVTVTGVFVAPAISTCAPFLYVFGGALYALMYDGVLNLVTGGAFVQKAPISVIGNTAYMGNRNPLLTLGGELYFVVTAFGTGTSPGILYKWDGVSAWVTLIPYVSIKNYLQMFTLAGKVDCLEGDTGFYEFDGVSAFTVPVTLGGAVFDQSINIGSQAFLLNVADEGLYEATYTAPATGTGMFIPVTIPGLS